MTREFAMLAWSLFACAIVACGSPHRAQRQSDFSVMEFIPVQHPVHREWQPGEAKAIGPKSSTAKPRHPGRSEGSAQR